MNPEEHHGWIPQEHEYDPEWDYEIQYDKLNHPLVQRAQQRLEQLAQSPETPMNPERPGRVFPVDLSHKNAVAMYCNGTYNEPCILIDPDGHRGYEDQVEKSVDHEVHHAVQEWNTGEWNDEDAAEDWVPKVGSTGGLKRPLDNERISFVSNILDPIHDYLAPQVWDDPADIEPRFKPVHKKWLMKTAIDVLEKGGYEGIQNYISFVVTGSIATYQYSDRSDVDTSLFIEFDNFPEWSRAEMIGLLVEEMDGVKLPGTPYDVQLFIQPSHIKPEDIFRPGLRSGYLLDEDRWLVPPDRSRVHDIQKEMNDTYTYALETADKMERLLKYEPHKAVMFWDQLHRRRARDQRDGKGDFSSSNIAYKFIVNQGLTEQLGEIMGKKIVL